MPGHHEVVLPVDYGPQVNPHVRARAVNVTATNPHSDGYLTVNGAATDAVDNHTSTLNFTAGATVANMAIIPTIPANGVPTIRVADNSPTGVDTVVDVLGYYDDGLAVGGLRHHPTAPTPHPGRQAVPTNRSRRHPHSDRPARPHTPWH